MSEKMKKKKKEKKCFRWHLKLRMMILVAMVIYIP